MQSHFPSPSPTLSLPPPTPLPLHMKSEMCWKKNKRSLLVRQINSKLKHPQAPSGNPRYLNFWKLACWKFNSHHPELAPPVQIPYSTQAKLKFCFTGKAFLLKFLAPQAWKMVTCLRFAWGGERGEMRRFKWSEFVVINAGIFVETILFLYIYIP